MALKVKLSPFIGFIGNTLFQCVVESYLFRKRKFAAIAVFPAKTETATVLGTPLTAAAIRTWVFFGIFAAHSVDNIPLDRISMQQLGKNLTAVGIYQQVSRKLRDTVPGGRMAAFNSKSSDITSRSRLF